MSSCSYANAFGAPNTGAHSIRFFGIAIVDVFLTFIVAAFTSFRFYNPSKRDGSVELHDDDTDNDKVGRENIHNTGSNEHISEAIETSDNVTIPERHTQSLANFAVSSWSTTLHNLIPNLWIARCQSIAIHFIAWFFLAEILHAAFGTQTKIISLLGGGRCG
jgi:hypothetical protein